MRALVFVRRPARDHEDHAVEMGLAQRGARNVAMRPVNRVETAPEKPYALVRLLIHEFGPNPVSRI